MEFVDPPTHPSSSSDIGVELSYIWAAWDWMSVRRVIRALIAFGWLLS